MPAIGLTRKQQTDSAESKFLAAKVYLGKRQDNGRLAANSDLKTQFRIQPLSDQVRKFLAQFYGVKPDANGDLLVDSINIIPISHDCDRTFDVWYKSYTAKKPLYVCDRNRIHKEWVEKDDLWGHRRGMLQDCDKPCPMADESNPFVDCPNGCKPSGILNFYIKELVEARLELPCQLTVVGKTNFQGGGLYDQWAAIASCYPDTIGQGFWSQAIAFPCGSYILCQLSRIEVDILRPQLDLQNKVKRMVNGKEITEGRRTGQKSKGKAHPLLLSVDPFWEATYYGWKQQVQAIAQAKELQALGFKPSAKLLEQAQIIDVEVVPRPLELSRATAQSGTPERAYLPPGNDSDLPITEDQLRQLKEITQKTWATVWRGSATRFLTAIDNHFGIVDLKNLPRSQFEAAKDLLENGEF